jgi:hypothetical protein
MKFKMGGSGIHIKPENKGKFTATKKATGKSTEELTHSKNPVTKKRAIFAQNAAKWKHDEGTKKLATADSTAYYGKQMEKFMKKRSNVSIDKAPPYDQKVNKAMSNMYRQTKKGKPGYDANGHPVIMKMKMGTKNVNSFPDLNKDGEITKADILKGRGVIKKTGTKSMKVDEKMCGSKGMKYQNGGKDLGKELMSRAQWSKITPKPNPDKPTSKLTVINKSPGNPNEKGSFVNTVITKAKENQKQNSTKKFKEGTKSIKFKKPMMKRADGSTSQRGLWDNLRSKAAENKKTGAKPKAPTKAMLSQEKKINSK